MKYFVLIILIQILVGCQPPPPKSSPEKIKTETEQVIETIRNQPEWLKVDNFCPRDIIPKDEKEVAYLDEGCEDNPNKCLESCKMEDANACYSLALLIQTRVDFKQQEATPLFLRACEFGIISGCTNAAAAKFSLDNSDSEAAKCLIDTFEKTCEKDDPWGCTMFGMVLAQGKDRQQDLDLALKVLSKSCKYGDEDEACQNAKKIEQQIKDFKKLKENDSNSNHKTKSPSSS